jgi:CysZ protein
MLWPMLVSVGIWLTVAVVFWTRAALWVAELLRGWIDGYAITATLNLAAAVPWVAHALLVLFFVPVVVLTALAILSVFGMEAMVEHVAASRFPQLARRRGGNVAGSVWNALVALGGMVLLFVVTLPLWILPPLWPLIPVAILAWVNQRILRYDALSEHAHGDEMRALYRKHGRTLYLLGLVLALVAYVPVVGFFAPVVVALAFIHFLLDELQALREAPIEGSATVVREE